MMLIEHVHLTPKESRNLRSLTGPHDHYWKLPVYTTCFNTAEQFRLTLRERGYSFAPSTPKDELERYVRRSDIGGMSYQPYSNEELREFLGARGISLKGLKRKRKGPRRELLDALEAADKNLTFHRLTDLPAELRLRIYQWYFLNFADTPLHAPTQPPITKASSLLRKEALPVFLQECMFVVDLYMSSNGASEPRHKFMTPTLMWLGGLTDASIGHIQNLQIRVWFNTIVYMDAYIYIGKGKKPRSLTYVSLDELAKPNGCQWPSYEKVVEKISDIAEKIALRDGPRKLRRDDIYDLRSAMEIR